MTRFWQHRVLPDVCLMLVTIMGSTIPLIRYCEGHSNNPDEWSLTLFNSGQSTRAVKEDGCEADFFHVWRASEPVTSLF